METISLLFDTLVPVGQALAPFVEQLRAERRAGGDSARVNTSLLHGLFEETLNRLQDIESHDSWWRELLQRAQSAYVRPEYLAKPSIREWLSEAVVRDGLKVLADTELLPGSANSAATKARLAERYAVHTGEASRLASGPIEIIVSILLAGALAHADKGDRLVAGLVQQSHQGIDAHLAVIETKIDALSVDETVIQVHSEKAEAALDLILRRRTVPTVDVCGEITKLAGQLENEGDFRFSASGTRTRIYLWAARLLAQRQDKVEAAREYRGKALSVDAAAETTIIDAWLSTADGDVDGGLARLRELDTPDGRSSLFAMLLLRRGREHALAWLDAHEATDPRLLTAVSWRNVATTLAEAGRWEDAATRLRSLPDSMAVECPDIAYVEGVINAGLTLPTWARRFALTTQIIDQPVEPLQGAAITEWHRRALLSFGVAKQRLTEVGEITRAAAAETWRAWLLLTDPTRRAEGERIVVDAMREGKTAVDYAQLAHIFGISFDPAPLERYLKIRELVGGLSPPEVGAKLALCRHTRSKAEVVSFIEQERGNLGSFVTAAGYWFLLVAALIDAGQFDRAEEVLNENRGAFGEDYDRVRDQIRRRRGEEVLTSFEERFLKTGADVDLITLCDDLLSGNDLDKLRRYSLELFRRQRNRHNAHRVCDVLSRMDRYRDLVEFLGTAEDLVAMDDDLVSSKAWGLFHIGRLVESKSINDWLQKTRDNRNDAGLELNLAVAMGTWEDFPKILAREWAERDDRAPRHLLHLAKMAADVDKDRAIELAREAARMEPCDPEILVAAGDLAYRVGRDEEAMPWIAEAARLSTPEDGLVKTGRLREVIDIVVAGADRTREVQEAFSAARVPLHMAVRLWKMPMARLLVSQARDNELARDPRRRTVIPVRHGVRGIQEMSPVRTIAADITSLMLLEELDLLPLVKKRFERIAIPWSTMGLLLTENQSCRFHQPSRLAGAKKLRELMVANTLRTFVASGEPPKDLVDEVGRDLAELVHAAKQLGGRVIRPLPIHRAQTFGEEEANLGEYAPLVMTISQFLEVLEGDAVLDRQVSDRARVLLASLEREEPLGTNEPGSGPLFLDGLAVAYLPGLALVDTLRRSIRDLRIHPSTAADIEALIGMEGETQRTVEAISRLRVWLRDGIAAGWITVMPRSGSSEEDELGIETRVFQELVADTDTADAVLIDDRMAGALGHVMDRSGRRAPIVDTVDLLRDLAGAGLLSSEERYHGHHVLRARGFICIPVEIEELENHLADTEVDPKTWHLRENAELRAIRENLERLRSTTILQQPAETPYLDRLRMTGFLAIRNMWLDTTVPIPVAIARTGWLWRNLMATPIDWAHTIVDLAGVIPPTTGFLNEVAGLLLTIPIADLERARAYRDWIEAAVLSPLERVSSGVLSDLAGIVQTRIKGLADERTA
jgi:tetratricopeptide (TPR) repeat protein